MPETTTELILKIDLVERTDYRGKPQGICQAEVYAYKPNAGYEDAPQRWMAGSESVWAQFALHACYGNLEFAEGRAHSFSYGYKPDGYVVEPQHIDRIHKGLKKAEKAYKKLCTDYGHPQTLGQDVVYVMRAIGVTRACWRLPEGRESLGAHRHWRVVTGMEDVRYHIDSVIEECRAKQLEAAQAA